MSAQLEPGEEWGERLNVPASRRPFADEQRRHRDPRSPAEVPGNDGSDAGLDVEAAKQRLGVNDRGLDLDDEQDLGSRMVGQQVDPASVAVAIEADLAAHDPSERLEPASPEGCHGGVIGVEQAIDLPSLPSDVPSQIQADGGGDRVRRPHRQPIDVAALEQRADRRADAARGGQVDDAPSAPMPSGTHGVTEATIIHPSNDAGSGLSRP